MDAVLGNTRPAIVVDYEAIKDSPATVEYLNRKQRHAAIVLFVRGNDYVPDDSFPLFDAVLSNRKGIPDIAFKTAALVVVQDSSNLVPVVGIDNNIDVLNMYEDAGMLITQQTGYFNAFYKQRSDRGITEP